MDILLLLFWFSFAGLIYIYFGYPLLIRLAAEIRPRPVDRSGDPEGTISVILVAHNEAAVLPRKIESLLASTIAGRIGEILVASDASTDDTEAVLTRLPDPRIRCLAFRQRRGKASCLNDAVASVTGDILVLTDARQSVAPDALEKLIRCVGDDSVGLAFGELIFSPESRQSVAGEGMGVYWEYEKFIRRQESLVHSVPGATGALTVLRRELFCPIPEDILLDDVFISMKVIERGYRCVLESGAFLYDEASETPVAEGLRKRRTLAGCVQLARRYPRWMVPGLHPIGWQYFSHKIVRLGSPLFLIGLLASSFALSEYHWIRVFCWAQCLGYCGVALGWVFVSRGMRVPLIGPAVLFVALNVTTLAALWDGIRGHYRVAWK